MERTNKDPATCDGGAQEDCSGRPLNKPPKTPPQAPSAWKRAATDTLLALRAKFPACFASSRQPLKLKIHLDILAAAPEIHPVNIGRALKLYTSNVGYRRECVEARPRIDLSGNPAGAVTAAEAAHAAELLAKQRKPRAGTPISSPPSAQSAPSPRLTLAALKEAAKRKSISGNVS
jgi:ProP effector